MTLKPARKILPQKKSIKANGVEKTEDKGQGSCESIAGALLFHLQGLSKRRLSLDLGSMDRLFPAVPG